MSDQDLKNILFFIGGMALVCVFSFVVLVWATRPTPMQICIKAGYEWIDGDCVKGELKE
jgi:hypothetical protein